MTVYNDTVWLPVLSPRVDITPIRLDGPQNVVCRLSRMGVAQWTGI